MRFRLHRSIFPSHLREKTSSADRPVERQRALDAIKRCLELGDVMGLTFVVLHLGNPGQAFNPVVFDHAYAAIATIQSFAGTRVLVETLSNDIATFPRILEFQNSRPNSKPGHLLRYRTWRDGRFNGCHPPER